MRYLTVFVLMSILVLICTAKRSKNSEKEAEEKESTEKQVKKHKERKGQNGTEKTLSEKKKERRKEKSKNLFEGLENPIKPDNKLTATRKKATEMWGFGDKVPNPANPYDKAAMESTDDKDSMEKILSKMMKKDEDGGASRAKTDNVNYDF